jgi:hypothetical protein
MLAVPRTAGQVLRFFVGSFSLIVGVRFCRDFSKEVQPRCSGLGIHVCPIERRLAGWNRDCVSSHMASNQCERKQHKHDSPDCALPVNDCFVKVHQPEYADPTGDRRGGEQWCRDQAPTEFPCQRPYNLASRGNRQAHCPNGFDAVCHAEGEQDEKEVNSHRFIRQCRLSDNRQWIAAFFESAAGDADSVGGV